VRRELGGADGNLGGSGALQSGTVSVHDINAVTVEGNLTASMTRLSPPSAAFASGGLFLLDVDGGVYGSIDIESFSSANPSTDGFIGSIDAGGPIGTLLNPVTIDCDGRFGSLVASELHADVNVGEFASRFETTTGDFTGEIRALGIFHESQGAGVSDTGLFVAGDMFGDLRTVPSSINGRVVIDGEFAGVIETSAFYECASVQTDCATHPVLVLENEAQGIIDATNTGDQWLGQLFITRQNGTVTEQVTDLPHYAREIGRGEIGIPPFSIHRESCTPVHQSSAIYTCEVSPGMFHPGLCEALVKFYGPVTGPTTAGSAFTVECKRVGISEPWLDVSSQFVAEFNAQSDRNVVRSTRDDGQPFAPGIEYRVTPKSTVTCLDVFGTPAADDQRPYNFTVAMPSGYCVVADITADGTCDVAGGGDGAVTLSDFSCYLTRWNNSETDADITTTGTCNTHAGGADGVDLSDSNCYLSNWSGSCT